MSSLKKLLVQFSHFLGGSALSLLLGLLTFPILTRALSREDYGILGLVTITISMAVAVAKGGLSDGIIRFYRDYADSPQRLGQFTSTILARGVVFTALTVVIYLLLIPSLNRRLGIGDGYLGCFLVMALFLAMRPLNVIVLNYLRALGKTFFYNVVTVCTKALGVALSLIMLFYVFQNLFGYFIGLIVAELVSGVVLYLWLLKNYSFKFGSISPGLTLNLIKFGLPLLLTELSYLLLSYVDRYMIVAYHGEAMLGLYTVGYNLPSYINDVIMFSLSYAVVPIYTELYSREGREETEKFLSRAMYYYLAFVIPICIGYYAVANDLLVLLASEKYAEAAVFSPVVLVGLVLLGMNSILYAGLYLKKKSRHVMVIMFAAVLINIGMNILLLPRYGATGAAIATLIACLCSSLLTAYFSFRHIRIHFDLPAIAYYAATSVLMGWVVLRIQVPGEFINLTSRILIGMLLFTAALLIREREIRIQLGALWRR